MGQYVKLFTNTEIINQDTFFHTGPLSQGNRAGRLDHLLVSAPPWWLTNQVFQKSRSLSRDERRSGSKILKTSPESHSHTITVCGLVCRKTNKMLLLINHCGLQTQHHHSWEYQHFEPFFVDVFLSNCRSRSKRSEAKAKTRCDQKSADDQSDVEAAMSLIELVELLLTLLHGIQKKVLGAQRLLGLESLQTDETPAVCHSPSSLQTLRKGEIKETDCLKQGNHLQGLQFSSPGEVEHFDSRVLQE